MAVNYDDIAARSDRVLNSLTGGPKSPAMLSKAEQLKRYKERIQNTKEVHPDILKIIQEHGYDGLREYLAAMYRMSKGEK